MRGGDAVKPFAYNSPAVLVSGTDSEEILVEISTDNGNAFTELDSERFIMGASSAENPYSGRVFQLFSVHNMLHFH